MLDYKRKRRQRQREQWAALDREVLNRSWQRSRLSLATSADDVITIKCVDGSSPWAFREDVSKAEPSEVTESPHLSNNDEVQRPGSENKNPAAKRGSKGITNLGRSTVREACAVIERDLGRNQLMLTLTLAGSTPEALAAFAAHMSEIINAYIQRLRTQSKKMLLSGQSLPYIGVVELQKRGALHLHIVVGLIEPGLEKFIRKHHRRWWTQILETFSNKSGVDLFARSEGGTWRDQPHKTRTQCAKVKKSVKRYMSKYLSKGRTTDSDEPAPTPTSWWLVSRDLLREVHALRLKKQRLYPHLTQAEDDMENLVRVCVDDIENAYPLCNPFTGAQIGWTLFLKPGRKEALWLTLCALLEEGPGREVMENLLRDSRPPPLQDGIESAA